MNERRLNSKGQVIVIFVLAIAALLIVGALVIDGGQAYMNRRAAQTAADAGALAGAHEYCYNGASNVETVALQYAQVENYSTTALVTMNADDTITVDVTIEQKNFLAQLFGRSETTVEAAATAGCYHPGAAMHLMPIAWSCRAPVAQSISGTCQAKGLDWATQLKPLIDGEDLDGNTVPYVEIDGVQYLTPYNFGKNGGIVDNRVYIVMDSDKAGIDHCKEIPGGGDELTCDLDGDGAIDLLGSGDRSWLDIDESNLKKSIENYYDTTISIHSWAPGETGVNAAVLDTIDQVIIQKGSIVMVPVINAVCPKGEDLYGETCQNLAHTGTIGLPLETGETDTIITGNGNTYYHIVGFIPFYVTCVKKQGNDKCPGHDWAVTNGGMKDNVKTMEGYFIDDFPMDYTYGTGGIDMGVNIISLTK